MTIYRTADKAGLQPRRGKVLPPITLRLAVQDMRPAEALEYALAAYEQVTGQEGDPRDLAPVALTPQQATIFALLYQRLGQTVRFDAIVSVMDVATGDATSSSDVLKIQIRLMRNRLAGHYAITTIRGFGYRMIPTEQEG